MLNKRIIYFFIAMLVCHATVSQADMTAKIESGANTLQPQLEKWRRHIHEYPELSNREVKTAAYVAAHLRKLGLDVREKGGLTGVVGILRGGKSGPVVALRAEMDALPVKERANISFKSVQTAE